jgi:hypothetical protein
LQLSSDKIAAAIACGITFQPASPDQVQRLSMQLKVFNIDGQPHLATRGGGFFETAATLESLIADRLDEQQQADLAAWEATGVVLPQESAAVPSAPTASAVLATVREPAAADAAEGAPTTFQAVPVMVTPLAPQRALKGDYGARWMMAGAERRGRAGQHWSARRKA